MNVEFRFLPTRMHTLKQILLMWWYHDWKVVAASAIRLKSTPYINGQHLILGKQNYINIYLESFDVKVVRIQDSIGNYTFNLNDLPASNFAKKLSEENMINFISNTIAHEYLHEVLNNFGVSSKSCSEKEVHEILVKKLGY